MMHFFFVTLCLISVDFTSEVPQFIGKSEGKVESRLLADEYELIKELFQLNSRRFSNIDNLVTRGVSCGTSTSLPSASIVGGIESRPNSIPFIISLQQYGSHFCGGSLIQSGGSTVSDIVLTAAHCLYDGTSSLTASAGAHDLTRPTAAQQTVKVSKSVYHPQYDPDTTMNDIAILKLEKPIRFTTAVQPVCLPALGEVPSAGTSMTIAGWGLTSEGGYATSPILLQTTVPVVGTTACASSYSRQGIKIDGTAMICAGYQQGGKDTCQGDSGGPLFAAKSNRYTLYGITSFGVGCARPGLPGVYTRVGNYLPWIQGQITALTSAP